MRIVVTRSQIVTTICVNWVRAGVIRDQEIELAAEKLVKVSNETLIRTLLESSQDRPENMEILIANADVCLN